MAEPGVRIARRLRRNQTDPEDRLWAQLRNRRFMGLKFWRQHPIAGAVVDFCCLDLRLTIELDGKHHADQHAADDIRRRAIERHGFLEIRFVNADVVERLNWVMRELERMVDVARAQTPCAPGRRWDPEL